jgi:hypothetical protein
MEGLWADLASENAREAYQAIWALIGDPERSVPFLSTMMKPVARANPVVVQRLIGELDDDRSATRDKAEAELGKLGEAALPFLHQTLKGKASPEVRRRVQQLIGKAEEIESPEKIRLLRGIEVLEQLGTTQAKTLLDSLASGSPQALLTREATAACDRHRGFFKPDGTKH